MAKAPPAFQFYPQDFMTGTARFTAAETGAYILLLCEQWHTGSVPGDDVKALALILRCGSAKARTIWAHIHHKFQREDSGVWLNARLEDERQRQKDFQKKQQHNATSGAKKRWEPVKISEAKDSRKVADSGANGKTADSTGYGLAMPTAMPNDASSSSSSVRTPSLPPSRGRRRRITPQVHADAEHIRKSQEVKRLIAEGLTFVDASRRAGFT